MSDAGDGAPFCGRPGLNVATYDLRARLDGLLFGDHAPFYAARAREQGGPVLDLGCGTGRIARAMAEEAGVAVTGVDRSAAMLDRAEARRAAADPEVAARLTFREGDMVAPGVTGPFGLVVIPLRGFQEILDPDDQRRALAAAHARLAPGGRLVLDLFDPRLEACLPAGDDAPLTLPPFPLDDGTTVHVQARERRNDPFHQIMREDWRFTQYAADGTLLREEAEVLCLRWTYRREMRYLLELAGFVPEAEYGDFDASPPAYGKQQIWVARLSTL